jgi:hypothetical protein
VNGWAKKILVEILAIKHISIELRYGYHVVPKVAGNDNLPCFQYLEFYCAVVDGLHHELSNTRSPYLNLIYNDNYNLVFQAAHTTVYVFIATLVSNGFFQLSWWDMWLMYLRNRTSGIHWSKFFRYFVNTKLMGFFLLVHCL